MTKYISFRGTFEKVPRTLQIFKSNFMNKVRIITDSASDLPKRFLTEHEIRVVPMRTLFADGEYVDGVTITPSQFYEKLIESDDFPTTSQPSPMEFTEVYREVREAGDTAVIITLSSKLSGTYQSAQIALEGFEDCIFLVDSLNAAMGEGALVERAVQLRGMGLTASEIAETLETDRVRLRLIALLDTLEYLKKGGRISKAAAFAGGLLSVKPVVAVEDGEVKLLGKARGSKQGNNMLNRLVGETGGVDFSLPIRLGYSGLSDTLLRKYIEDSRELWHYDRSDLSVDIVGSTIGTHAGPGAIAVAFFSKE